MLSLVGLGAMRTAEKFGRKARKRGGAPLTPEDVYVGAAAVTIPKWRHWTKAAKEKLDKMMGQDASKVAA